MQYIYMKSSYGAEDVIWPDASPRAILHIYVLLCYIIHISYF